MLVGWDAGRIGLLGRWKDSRQEVWQTGWVGDRRIGGWEGGAF